MRWLGALTAAIVALALAGPVSSGAAPIAGSAGKHACKHRKKGKHHRRKRCRKKSTAQGPGSGGGGGGTGKPTQPTGPPGRLLATERELSTTQLQLQLSRATLAAGPTILQQYNAGSDPHNLILERRGAVAFSYPTLDPGGTQSQTVNLGKGTWVLYCSLLDHRSLGMQATLTVN
jgi:plastocyanin